MRPDAVLFDFGGVLTTVATPDDGPAVLGRAVVDVLDEAGLPMDPADVLADLRAGLTAFSALKTSQSRMIDPPETSPEGFWELVVCDWDLPRREAVFASAAPLCHVLEQSVIRRTMRPRARETLKRLRENAVSTALVCNCLSGDAARAELRDAGMAGALDAEVYSVEFGRRKPGAAIVHQALGLLGVAADRAVFVGDKLNRDVLGARRAGIGTVVLMRTEAGPGPAVRGIRPDHEVADLDELLSLLGM